MALGIGPGDEVITTTLSAVATALCIEAVGAAPVFVDIDDYGCISPEAVEKAITPKTKAIIPVHLYGQMADMEKIMDIAKRRGVKVVEDCAQATGASYGKNKAGSFGALGCFSFYPTKNLGAIGDGGMITTDDDALAEKCRLMRNYGQKTRYEHVVYGINSRLDEIQAAILSERIKYLDKNNKVRADIAASLKKGLEGVGDIKLPGVRNNAVHTYHLFVIQTESRDALQAHLKEKGIETLIHYPAPIHKQKCFAKYNTVSLPRAETIVGKILTLPTHPYLSQTEIDYMCASIRSFYEK